jgi:hypothetical protein
MDTENVGNIIITIYQCHFLHFFNEGSLTIVTVNLSYKSVLLKLFSNVASLI